MIRMIKESWSFFIFYYFCDFCDICGHFRALLGFFCFQVLILFRFVIFATFAMFFTGVSPSKKDPCTFAIFADISGSFLASFFSKS